MDGMEENVESASAYSGVLQRRSLHQTQYVPFGSPLRREAREEKWESQRNQINSDKEPTPEKRETKKSKTNKPKRNNYKLQDGSNGAGPAVYSASVNGTNANNDEDKGCVDETGQNRKEPELTLADALVQDRLKSVKLFLKNGNDLSQFKKISSLQNLYLECFKEKNDVSARLLRKRINKLRFIEELKQALCCGYAKDNEKKPGLLNYIGNVIADLLGNKNINMYPVQGKEQLENHAKHLFIWAVLMNRMRLARFFWRIGTDYYIETALFASCLLKKLSKMASDEYEQELSESLTRHSSEYEMMASKVLDICYQQNRERSKQLLIREMSELGNTTLFCLAEENKLMDFMGRTCCQAKLEDIWKDVIPLSTSRKMIVASIFMPLLISVKLFVENKFDDLNPLCTKDEELMPEHQDDAFREDSCVKRAYRCNEKVTSSPDSKSKTQEGVGHHWCCKKAKECFQDICSFYTAPVTKFITTMFANIVFLGLFSFFVLTDLHPLGENGAPSLVEIFTWIYAINGVMDEINQVVTRNHGSIWYNIRSWLRSTWNWFDIAIYLSFLTSVILRLSLYGKDFIWARMLYSLTLGMCFFRLLQYFDADKNIGPKVTMISRMLNDLRFFLLILVVFILSFGVTYHANLYPNAPQQWSVLKDVLYYPYWQMYGELSLENIEGNEPSEDAGTCTKNETLWRSGKMERCPEKSFLAVLVMAAFLLLTNVLLLNLLIAMFSDTVKKVHDNSEMEWKFHRFFLVYEYYNKPFLFQPLNILVYIFWPLRRHFCKKDRFKMKLNEVDHELSKLQREAMKKYMPSWWTEIENKLKTIFERVDTVNENVDEIKDKVYDLWWRHQKLKDR
uniref:Ion transport domain-containing protein n=1 Tax=Magallana gigas TaxID=29159 RepID=A0A8W8JN38_MAGGI